VKRQTYTEQLKHPLWQRRRLEILSRAGFQCSRCHDGQRTLHVHHKKYRGGLLAWQYADDELEVLCEPCHRHEHGIQSTDGALSLAAVRKLDSDWRRDNPDDAAAFDALKARVLAELGSLERTTEASR